jgi:GT2 family glycosyltransferase
MKVLVHIVTWNSESTIRRCLDCVLSQEGWVVGRDLFIRVTDNASTDGTAGIVRSYSDQEGVRLVVNEANLGFSAAHNQGAAICLSEGCDAMLVLNPDVGLTPHCLRRLTGELGPAAQIGMVSPKLLRARSDLGPLLPPVLDAAGMILTPALRHFDRGSGEIDAGQWETPEVVFGGTGACLLIAAECIKAVAIPKTIPSEAVWRIYPQLKPGASERIELFDEAFFAYREDADLAWRTLRLGWRCIYEPQAIAYHVRVVTPERRASLPSALNRLGVRNRFLLQLNNWDISHGINSLVFGVLWRNIVVVLGVFLKERSSLPALREVLVLARRARLIYRHVKGLSG